jgi:Ca2+-binding RTX toxin-like protein
MATTVITTSTSVSGTNVTLGTGVNLLLLSGIYRVSSAGTAILAANATHDITLLGTVFGDLEGLRLGTSSSLSVATDVVVGQGAELLSRVTAIESLGTSLSIHNEGLIKGGAAIDHAGNFFTLVNLGSIVGTQSSAVRVIGTASSITNYGMIQATSAFDIALRLESSDVSTARVENFGTIASVTTAIFGGTTAADTVLNHGRIVGTILLSGGDDLYDGHDGAVSGVVDGGSGEDTLLGGAGRETLSGGTNNDMIDGGGGDDSLSGSAGTDVLDGGDGNDTIRPGADADIIDGGAGERDLLTYFGSTVAVSVNLATGDASGGDAAGDEFTGMEGLAGGSGNDTLTGDARANRLIGNSGNDLLVGGAGSDTLSGGEGIDTLNGGTGVDILRGGAQADIFRFITPAEIGTAAGLRDRIADFLQADGDRIDLSFIDANATIGGNQAFSAFQGGGAFTGAGQLRAEVFEGLTILYGNTDANLATAEFAIALTGAVTFQVTDFIL